MKMNLYSREKCLPWLVIFVASLFFFYSFIQVNFFNALSTNLMVSFGLNAKQLGYLSAAFFLATILFLFPAGILLDRFSPKKIILITLSLYIVSTTIFALATNFYIAIISQFLTGIGDAFCFLSCFRIANNWFSNNKMALITGLIGTIGMTGGLIAQVPMYYLIKILDWREAVLVDAGFGVIILALIFFIVEDSPQKQNCYNPIIFIHLWANIKKSICNSQNWICAFYACLMNSPFVILGALWGVSFLKHVHNISGYDASLITSMLFVGSIFGAPLTGFISDKLYNRKIPMMINAILSIIIMCVILLLKNETAFSLMFLFFVLGLASSAQILSFPVVAKNNPPEITSLSTSIVSFVTMSGYAIIQPLFGAIMNFTWNGVILNKEAIYSLYNFKVALLILPTTLVIALFLILFIKE